MSSNHVQQFSCGQSPQKFPCVLIRQHQVGRKRNLPRGNDNIQMRVGEFNWMFQEPFVCWLEFRHRYHWRKNPFLNEIFSKIGKILVVNFDIQGEMVFKYGKLLAFTDSLFPVRFNTRNSVLPGEWCEMSDQKNGLSFGTIFASQTNRQNYTFIHSNSTEIPLKCSDVWKQTRSLKKSWGTMKKWL